MALPVFNPRFLVVSLGNPGVHYETLHSAGHVVLNAALKLLPADQPPWKATRFGKEASLASLGPKYILAQSPVLMNLSGRWVGRTWKGMLAKTDLAPDGLGFVLVHDDLEEELGVVKIRDWTRSHRGHNGVKSVNLSLRHADFPSSRWTRLSIGIGRPANRDTSSVSDYVLRPLSGHQMSVLRDQAAPAMLEALAQLEARWEQDFLAAVKKDSHAGL